MSREIRFSYGGDPSASDIDAVRFLVGDTNADRPLLDDREVEFAISQEPDPNLAGAILAEHLFGLFSAKGNIKVGPVSKDYSKVAEMFKKKADQLREAACRSALPSFPATHHSTKDVLDENTDLVRPNFLVGLSDNPFAVQINNRLDRARFHGF